MWLVITHRQLEGINVGLAEVYKAVPASGSSTYILRWSKRNTELHDSFSNYLHLQVSVITKTDGLSNSQRSLPKGNHKYTTKEGTTILMIWPVSSYVPQETLTEVEVISATEEYFKDAQFGSASASAA